VLGISVPSYNRFSSHLCVWVVLQVVWAVVPKEVLDTRQQQLVGRPLLDVHAKLTQPGL
jgi:hypothetical protein